MGALKGMCFDYTAFRQMRLWMKGLITGFLHRFMGVRIPLGAPNSNQALHLAGLFYTLKKITGGRHACIHQKTTVLSSLRLPIRHISANGMPEMREIQGRLMAFFNA